MGTINIYSALDSSRKVIKANGKLKDIVPEIDFSKVVVLNGGETINQNYNVKEKDVIFIRTVPSGVTTALIAVGVAAIAVGVGVGVALWHDFNEQLREQQEKAQRDANNLAQQINQLSFIKGAKNKTALGNDIQYLMGSCYNTPYTVNTSFYKIGGTYGDKLYWLNMFSCGWGPQQITDVLCGTQHVISDAAGISDGVHTVDESSIFYDPENKIEICQNGEDFTDQDFSQKVICTQDGEQIKHEYGAESKPIIRTLSDFTQKVEVCIQLNGLRQYNNEASTWEKRLLKIVPSWSNDNGATWNEFQFAEMQDNTISLNVNHTVRFVATKTFTAAEAYNKEILIKVEKVTPNRESNSNEDVYLLYYQSYCYDNKISSAEELIPCKPLNDFAKDKTSRFAVKFISNENTKDLLDEFHTLGCGLARVWDKDTQTWSQEKQPTRNPAAWLLEIATSDIHKHSQYLDSELDLDSFGALYEYCEEEEFYTDAVITKAEKKESIFSKILQTVNADFVENYTTGLKEIVIDKKEDTPVALLSAQTIRSVTYAKSFERQPDGQKITFVNRDNWLVDTMYCMLDGGEKEDDDVITETNLEYITTAKHAYKMSQRKMREMVLQPKIFDVKVGKEGAYYPLYKTINLQLERFKIGLKSSVIHKLIYSGAYIAGLEIADAVTFETGVRYGVLIQAQNNTGKRLISKEVTGTSKTRILYFTSVLPNDGDVLPELYNQLTFGELDENGEFTKVTNVMKIVNLSPDGNDGYILSLKDYNPAIYEYGVIPEYKSNLTSRQSVTKQEITDVRKAIQDSIVESVEQARSQISADAIRTLSSLDEPGTEGEIATYRGNVYVYHGAWTKANAQGYLGVYMNDAPTPLADCFFLAGATFSDSVGLLTNKGVLTVKNGLVLGVTRKYKKGSVYLCENGVTWSEITDKNDWRYIIATNDQYEIGGEISPGLEAATVGKVYEETGLAALENKKFIDEETRTINADLIDANTIKGKEGFFDDITVTNAFLRSSCYFENTQYTIGDKVLFTFYLEDIATRILFPNIVFPRSRILQFPFSGNCKIRISSVDIINPLDTNIVIIQHNCGRVMVNNSAYNYTTETLLSDILTQNQKEIELNNVEINKDFNYEFKMSFPAGSGYGASRIKVEILTEYDSNSFQAIISAINLSGQY